MKPEHPEESHTDTGRMCKLHTDSDPSRESNPDPCEAEDGRENVRGLGAAASIIKDPPRTPDILSSTFFHWEKRYKSLRSPTNRLKNSFFLLPSNNLALS